jgi:hypothetical protein
MFRCAMRVAWGKSLYKPCVSADSINHDILIADFLAEGEGFEPPVPFGNSGFQDRRLKPLGHPSSKILFFH